MRITADNIDYNAMRLIDENTRSIELSEHSESEDNSRIANLGYIKGIIDMAKTMKEVLKA